MRGYFYLILLSRSVTLLSEFFCFYLTLSFSSYFVPLKQLYTFTLQCENYFFLNALSP